MSDSDFSATIKGFAAMEVVRRLGCPLPTVYAYRSGHRLPPEWQRAMILDRLLTDGPPSEAAAGRGRGRPRKATAG